VTSHLPEELRRFYGAHFEKNRDYRQRIWSVLVRDFFQTHVSSSATVLDLGCGYGEFINCIQCGQKLALDLNPEAAQFLAPEVRFLQQDCSTHWQCGNESLDVVFTCNFSEYLPSKEALRRMLSESFRCLKPGGKLLAMGPNIRFLPGEYWDFWDHHLALSDRSLAEGMRNCGFQIMENHARFLPYTMANQREHPKFLLWLYLKLRPAWRFFGRQFLIVAQKP